MPEIKIVVLRLFLLCLALTRGLQMIVKEKAQQLTFFSYLENSTPSLNTNIQNIIVHLFYISH